MLLAAPLALLLIAASPSDEGRGTAGTTPEEALSMRTGGRMRLGLGLGLLFGLANYSPSLGVGFGLDLGVVAHDRLAFFIHAELGTIVLTVIGSGAAVVEYALGEHFSAGLGVGFTAFGPLLFGGGSGFYGLTFPLRVSFAPVARSAAQTARTGLLIGLQVAPGVSLQPTNQFQSRFPIPPEPAFAATLSVGYAWW